MAQLSIDTTTGRLTVADGGFTDCDGLEAVRQHLWLRLNIFLGECAYDVNLGVAIIQEVAAAGTSPERIAAIFRETILGTPKVRTITRGPILAIDADRGMTLSFSCDTDEGPLDYSGPINAKPMQEVD